MAETIALISERASLAATGAVDAGGRNVHRTPLDVLAIVPILLDKDGSDR